jgi:hypothetical protein
MFGQWVIAHEEMDDFAEAASVMLAPRTYADAGSVVHPIIIGQGTLISLVCKYDGDAFGPITSPTFRVWGCDQVPNDLGIYPTSSILRIDKSGFTSTGSTFTFDWPNDQTDPATNNAFSRIFQPAGMALRGAKSVLILHESNGSAGGVIMQCWARVF